jgi:lipopolysaccharide biosynthesis glycosyltransferase
MPNDIHILFATDKNYVPYMAVSIHSLLENVNNQDAVHIHIIEDDIGDENKALLQGQVKNTSGTLDFIAW